MTPYYAQGGITLYHGDFRAVLAGLPSSSLTAVLTDPPYPHKYQRLYGDLAWHCPRVLQRGGSLLAIIPQYNLPYVVREVGRYLKWRWVVAMIQGEGAHPRMAMGVEVGWKPVGWWVNGAWPQGRGFRRDWFVSRIPKDERRKQYHPWEQNLSWAEAMLRFVPAGGLVCDPMMGAGTLLVAAARAGYPAIGVDCEESCCETTAQRLQLELAEPSQEAS